MRIRTIKPEWLDDETMALAPLESRVLSIALILLADDYGNGRANDALLASRVFPASANPRESLAKARVGLANFLVTYEVNGQSYFHIRNWERHQRVDRPGKPLVPPYPGETEISPANIREGHAKVRGTLATDLDLDLEGTTTATPATAATEPTIADMYSKLRSEAWKAKHGKPGGRYQRSTRDYDPMHHAIAFFAGESDPLAALDDSMRGYFADEWATGADWPFSTWAKDPGKYQGKSSTNPSFAAEVKRLEADFTAKNRAIDVAAPERRQEAESAADAARVALTRARARLRATEARQ